MSGKKTNDTGQKPLPKWYDGAVRIHNGKQ